jgi:hypothetical protein
MILCSTLGHLSALMTLVWRIGVERIVVVPSQYSLAPKATLRDFLGCHLLKLARHADKVTLELCSTSRDR